MCDIACVIVQTAQICGAIAIVADIPVLVLFGFGYADACVFLAAALAIAAGTKDVSASRLFLLPLNRKMAL
jgi:hypothetical protein